MSNTEGKCGHCSQGSPYELLLTCPTCQGSGIMTVPERVVVGKFFVPRVPHTSFYFNRPAPFYPPAFYPILHPIKPCCTNQLRPESCPCQTPETQKAEDVTSTHQTSSTHSSEVIGSVSKSDIDLEIKTQSKDREEENDDTFERSIEINRKEEKIDGDVDYVPQTEKIFWVENGDGDVHREGQLKEDKDQTTADRENEIKPTDKQIGESPEEVGDLEEAGDNVLHEIKEEENEENEEQYEDEEQINAQEEGEIYAEDKMEGDWDDEEVCVEEDGDQETIRQVENSNTEAQWDGFLDNEESESITTEFDSSSLNSFHLHDIIEDPVGEAVEEEDRYEFRKVVKVQEAATQCPEAKRKSLGRREEEKIPKELQLPQLLHKSKTLSPKDDKLLSPLNTLTKERIRRAKLERKKTELELLKNTKENLSSKSLDRLKKDVITPKKRWNY